MVLQTGQEINELDSSGFATAQTTVFAGNLGGECTLQLAGLRILPKFWARPDPEMFFPSVADPDPASGAFCDPLDPDPGWEKMRIRYPE